MVKSYAWGLLSLILLTSNTLFALNIEEWEGIGEITGVQVYSDTSGHVDLDGLRRSVSDAEWTALEDFSPPVSKTGAYWLTFQLENSTAQTREMVLGFDRWPLVEVFTQNRVGDIQRQQTGQLVPYGKRDYPFHAALLVKTKLAPQDTYKYWVRVDKEAAIGLPAHSLEVQMGNKEAMDDRQYLKAMLNTSFLAILLFILFTNFMYFFSAREKSFRFYLVVNFIVILETFRWSGFYGTLFPDWQTLPHFEWYFMLLNNFLLAAAFPFLAREILNTRKLFPKWDKALLWIPLPIFIVTLLFLVNPSLGIFAMILICCLGTVLANILNLISLKRNNSLALFFLLVSLIFGIFETLHFLSLGGWIQLGDVWESSLRPLGGMLCDIVLSLAIGRVLLGMKARHERKQEQVILHLREHRVLRNRLGREVINSQEAVRKSVSERLHGEIQNLLVSVRFNLMAFSKSLEKRGEDHKIQTGTVEDAMELLKESVGTVRRISHALMPGALDDPLGLAPSIEYFLERRGLPGKVDFSYEHPQPLPLPIRTLVYRTIQDLTTLAQPAAQLEYLKVRLWHDAHSVHLIAELEGTQRLTPDELRIMEHPLHLFGGQLVVESPAPHRQKFQVVIPLEIPENVVLHG